VTAYLSVSGTHRRHGRFDLGSQRRRHLHPVIGVGVTGYLGEDVFGGAGEHPGAARDDVAASETLHGVELPVGRSSVIGVVGLFAAAVGGDCIVGRQPMPAARCAGCGVR
jgi:hypothetical protein